MRVLAALASGLIVALGVIQVIGGTGAIELGLQIALLALFAIVAVWDLRAATIVVMLELVLGGASGRWTELPGGISGRIAIDAILVAAAAFYLLRVPLAPRERILGRYTLHAVGLAIALPAIWMALGLARGNTPHDVFADGNGTAFFAFALVFVALARLDALPEIRLWVFRACALNGMVLAALLALTTSGVVGLDRLDRILISDLGMGGIIGHMPNGAFRLYVGSGLYLQIGLALTTLYLLRSPSRVTLWAVYAFLWVDVVASYTRGFWLGALVAVVITLVLGATNWTWPALVAAVTVALFAIAGGLASLGNASFASYLVTRASTIVASGPRHVPRAIVADGSFETGRATWQTIPGGSELSVDRTRARFGRASARLTYLAGADLNLGYQQVRLQPVQHLVTAWVYVPDDWRGGPVALKLENFAGAVGTMEVSADMSRRDRWQRLELTAVPSKADPAGDVVVRAARRPPPGSSVWLDAVEAHVQLLANGGFERTTAPWESVAGTKISRDPSLSHSGAASAKLTYLRGADYNLGFQDLTLRPAATRVSTWLYVPRNWGDTPVELRVERFGGSTGTKAVAVDTTLRDRWQRLSLVFTPEAKDRLGSVVIRSGVAARRGGSVNIDDAGANFASPLKPLTGSVAAEGSGSDSAGAASNELRIEQARILFRHIKSSPLVGHGFGAVAHELRSGKPCAEAGHCNPPYSYELAYLDLLFKAGIVGLILFLSFHLRIVWDALRVRFGRLTGAAQLHRQDAAVVVAIVVSILLTGAFNPYVLAAFGIFPVVLALAWLEPPPSTAAPGQKAENGDAAD